MSQSDYLHFKKEAMQWSNLGNDYPVVLNADDYVHMKRFAVMNTIQTNKQNIIDATMNNLNSAMVNSDGLTLNGNGYQQRSIMDMEINDLILSRYPLNLEQQVAGYSCKFVTATSANRNGQGDYQIQRLYSQMRPLKKPLKKIAPQKQRDISWRYMCKQCPNPSGNNKTELNCMCANWKGDIHSKKSKNNKILSMIYQQPQEHRMGGGRTRYNNTSYHAGSY